MTGTWVGSYRITDCNGGAPLFTCSATYASNPVRNLRLVLAQNVTAVTGTFEGDLVDGTLYSPVALSGFLDVAGALRLEGSQPMSAPPFPPSDPRWQEPALVSPGVNFTDWATRVQRGRTMTMSGGFHEKIDTYRFLQPQHLPVDFIVEIVSLERSPN